MKKKQYFSCVKVFPSRNTILTPFGVFSVACEEHVISKIGDYAVLVFASIRDFDIKTKTITKTFKSKWSVADKKTGLILFSTTRYDLIDRKVYQLIKTKRSFSEFQQSLETYRIRLLNYLKIQRNQTI